MKHLKRKDYINWAVFVGLVICFALLIKINRTELDQKIKTATFEKSSSLITLKNWKATFKFCERSWNRCDVDPVGPFQLELPEKDRIRSIVKKHAHTSEERMNPYPYIVDFEYQFTPDQQDWIIQQNIAKKRFNLVLPMFFARSISLMIGDEEIYLENGEGPYIWLVSKYFFKNHSVPIKLRAFANTDWTGPVNVPPAIVLADHTYRYATIETLSVTASFLNRLQDIVIPLLIAGMALIVNHVKGMYFLSLFSFSMAARAVAGMYSHLVLGADLWWLLALIYGLAPPLLLRYVLALCGKAVRPLVTTAGTAGISCFAYFLYAAGAVDIQKLDNLLDGLAGLIGLGFLIFHAYELLKKEPEVATANHTSNGTAKVANDTGGLSSSKTQHLITTALAAFLLLVSGWINMADYLSPNSEKDILHWGHYILVPGLLFTIFIDMGSVVNTIRRVSGIVAEKTRIDRDLEISRQLQKGILPEKKSASDAWKWHAFYYPASKLAGDWYDLRKVDFADGKTGLLACVVDVTGHGISSAMMTANIASHWSLWAESLSTEKLCEKDEDLKEVLSVAPQQIHRGLVGLRYNLGCSMAAILFLPSEKKLVYLTAGHPGVILDHYDKFEYLVTKGTRPGVASENALWNVDVKHLEDKPYQIILYSDGIVEQDKSVPVWLKHVKRKMAKTNTSSLYHFLSQLRTNKKYFRKNIDKEDDLTLLVIKTTAKNSS